MAIERGGKPSKQRQQRQEEVEERQFLPSVSAFVSVSFSI